MVGSFKTVAQAILSPYGLYLYLYGCVCTFWVTLSVQPKNVTRTYTTGEHAFESVSLVELHLYQFLTCATLETEVATQATGGITYLVLRACQVELSQAIKGSVGVVSLGIHATSNGRYYFPLFVTQLPMAETLTLAFAQTMQVSSFCFVFCFIV